MSQITDLTGTKWEFNEDLSGTELEEFYEDVGSNFDLDFISNNSNYDNVAIEFVMPLSYNIYYRNVVTSDTQVYDYVNGWLNQSYRIIEITGGPDVTEPALISAIQGIATQIIEPEENSKISIGASPLVSASVGNAEMQAIWVGNVKVYEATETQ